MAPSIADKGIAMKEFMRGFTDDEARLILADALALVGTSGHAAAAKRWIPWLLAYTGASAGEVVRLSREDVVQIDGIWAIKLKADASSVKGAKGRAVPLHLHLIEQGFVDFVQAQADGPLFVAPGEKPDRVRDRIAERVRKIGIVATDVAPSLGWRHRLATELRRVDVDRDATDAILGLPSSSKFGLAVSLVRMRDGVAKLPRIEVAAAACV
jgi:integrase